MTNDRKLANISKSFDSNARKAFPYKSMYQITKELNKMLEKVIYERPKKKRKHK